MRYLTRILLPLLLLVYIAVETYLKLHHTSLCSAQGCKLAGELLRFDAIYLNYFGLGAAFVMLLLGIASFKSQKAESFFFALLYGAVAFEGTIFLYQLYSNPEPCLFCMGVFGGLLLIAVANRTKDILSIFAIVLALASGLGVLAIPKNQSLMQNPGRYLIFSATCPHCKKVKAYLKKEHIDYTPISVTTAGARYALKFMGISHIPVLAEKEAHSLHYFVGDETIIDHIKQTRLPADENKETAASSNAAPILDTGFLSAGGADEGCTLSITEPSPCKGNTTEPHP